MFLNWDVIFSQLGRKISSIGLQRYDILSTIHNFFHILPFAIYFS